MSLLIDKIVGSVRSFAARQIRIVAREAFSPQVMETAINQLKDEFKREMRNYRRKKEEENEALAGMSDQLMQKMGTVVDAYNMLSFKYYVLQKVVACCSPPFPGRQITAVQITELAREIEEQVKNDPEQMKLFEGSPFSDKMTPEEFNKTLIEFVEGH